MHLVIRDIGLVNFTSLRHSRFNSASSAAVNSFFSATAAAVSS
jgi:hypothetical protein